MDDQSNSPISSSLVDSVDEFPVETTVVVFGERTIATRAKLMSFRIINDTRNPDHDKKYKTNRAGIRSESKEL